MAPKKGGGKGKGKGKGGDDEGPDQGVMHGILEAQLESLKQRLVLQQERQNISENKVQNINDADKKMQDDLEKHKAETAEMVR